VEEMDETITKNFLSVLKSGDILYFLGDMSFQVEPAEKFFNRLPIGITIHYIRGNHDIRLTDEFLSKYCASISLMRDIKIEGQKITLCHYAMLSWNCSCHNSWSIHGHHHSKIIEENFKGKRMNVGVDVNNFYPYSFSEISKIMETKEDNEDLVKYD
jgi:calcineurin-like phosphoesterase family protein